MKKHFITILILSILVIVSCLFNDGVFLVNADNSIKIEITNTSLKVGDIVTTQITGDVPNTIEYKWYRGESLVANSKDYTLTPIDYEYFITVKIYADNICLAKDSVFFSVHPVIYLNFDGVITREEYINADMFIQGNNEFNSQYQGATQIKGRGTKSFSTDKKPYKLKLDKKTDLFGLGKSKHFVLLNNYYDSSLIRNATAFELSNWLGLTTTDYVWVDVVVNGEYQGNYLLCEHIRIEKSFVDIYNYEDLSETFAKNVSKDFPSINSDDLEDLLSEDLSWLNSDKYTLPNGELVLISDYVDKPKDYNGGFLWEITNSDDYTYKTNKGIKITVSKPEQIATNSQMLNKSKEILQDFEDALYSQNGYNDKGKHYSELADINSMVNYFLVNEILDNEDCASRSRFAYQDMDGKIIFGPCWDFDIGSGSYLSYKGATGWCATSSIVSYAMGQDIFYEMVNDPYFQTVLRDRYLEIRDYLEYLIEDNGLIDNLTNKVYESGIVNSNKWYNFSANNRRDFSSDIDIYKKHISDRIKWLDSVFLTNESTYKSFITLLGNNNYITSNDLKINCLNCEKDSSNSNNAYKIDSQKDIEIKINSLSGYDNQVYVNGLFVQNVDSNQTITLPSNLFDRQNGENNVISIIATNKNKTIKNYITIKIGEMASQEIPCEKTCTHTNTTHIDETTGEAGHYDIKECDYCLDCGKYLIDGNPVNKSSVIINKNNYTFKLNKYQWCACLIVGGIIIAIIIIIVLIKVIKNLKRKRDEG